MNTLTVTADKKDCLKQLHLNLWDSKKNNLHFLDIGILCKNDKYNISIQLPLANETPIVENLSQKIIGDVPNAIFNEPVNTEENNKIKVLKLPNKRFVLSPVDEISCVKHYGEEGIHIGVEKVLNQQNALAAEYQYFRFRITNFDLSKVIIELDSKSKSFESSFTSYKIVDFRVNDAKLLPVIESQKLSSNTDKFEKIHFLYMTDIDTDIQLTGKDYSSRFLERRIWDDYLDFKKENKSDMLVYHLKQGNSSSANFLIKCSYNKTSIVHLIVYAAVVIALAIVANKVPDFVSLIFTFIKTLFVKG